MGGVGSVGLDSQGGLHFPVPAAAQAPLDLEPKRCLQLGLGLGLGLVLGLCLGLGRSGAETAPRATLGCIGRALRGRGLAGVEVDRRKVWGLAC